MPVKSEVKLTSEAKRLNVVFAEYGGALRPFADVLGISLTSIARMLKGEQAISYQVVSAVCYKLGYNPHWFLSGVGKKKDIADRQGKILTDIAMFSTELQIVNARVDVAQARMKAYEQEIEGLKAELKSLKQ